MGAKTSSLMAHINDLNDRGDYEGIIKFIEALTPEEQTSDMVSQLARAYNNLAQAGETQPLEKALQLLDSIITGTFGEPIRFTILIALLSLLSTGRRLWSTSLKTRIPSNLFNGPMNS